MDRKTAIITILALGVLTLAGIYGVKTIQAQDSDSFPPIIQKLAERFNLNTDEVQQFFQENREEKHQEMQTRFEERLNQAVQDGQITEEQKQAILDKKAQMQAQRETHRKEMKLWAEEQGIDFSGLFDFGCRLGGRGFSRKFW